MFFKRNNNQENKTIELLKQPNTRLAIIEDD